MKKLLLAIAVSMAIPLCFAAEQLDLTTPYDPDARTTLALELDFVAFYWSDSQIVIGLKSVTNDIKYVKTYKGEEARSLMILLNKADLTSNSLQKRIFTKMITDGMFDGTVSGIPD